MSRSEQSSAPESPTSKPRPIRRTGPRKRPPRPYRLPTFGLSVTSLVATGLAAVTATVAASYLGVAGTVIGAALFSVMTSVGKEIYDHSLRRTGHRVREVVPVTRVIPRVHEADPAGLASAAPREASQAPEPAAATGTAQAPPILPAPIPRTAEATKWRRIALSAVGVFVAVLAVITGVELVGGRPVSDLVRGDGGSGTSLFGHVQTRTRTQTVPPVAPTITKTVIPKVVVTTPTLTRTASPVTRTNTAPTTPRSSVSGSASGSTTRTSGTPTPSKPTTP